MKANLYVCVVHDTVEQARESLARFEQAGLNTGSPRVHVAIGDPHEEEI